MVDTDFSAPDHNYRIGLRENRLRGERIVAVVRIILALCALAGFIVRKLMSNTFYGTVLEYLYLGALGLAVLYSLSVLCYLKHHGYSRFVPFVSTTVDVTAISFTILIILAYAIGPSRALIYFTMAYSVYHLAILLSVRRYDSQNGLFAGALAAVQYLIIVLSFRYAQVFPVNYAFGTSSLFQNIVPSELFKSLLLFLTGVLAFSLSRNLTRRLLTATRTEGALRVEEAYLTQFFESTPEAIVLSDNQTRILRINNAFSQLFGYSEEETLGRSIDELVAPKHLRSEGVGLTQTAQGGAEFLIETERRLTESILQRSGYQVISAANAEQVLNLSTEELEEIQVLITDVIMPGMNGRILARKLKERFSELKVLFLSGYAADVTGAELSGDPMGELLQKPFSWVDLLGKLRQLIDG